MTDLVGGHVTASSYRRIVRHLERQGILFPDDDPRNVANTVRSFLRGLALRRASMKGGAA